MSLKPGEDVGLEIHEDTDQFFMLEEGRGVVSMGETKDNLNIKRTIREGYGFIIPANTWHNFTNTSNRSEIFSLYAPPHHPLEQFINKRC